MAAVLCSALYPNIVQILTPELRYKKTASGALCKAHTADEIKVTYLDTFLTAISLTTAAVTIFSGMASYS